MCVNLFQCVVVGYLIKFNSIMIARLFFPFQMDNGVEFICVHYTVNWFCRPLCYSRLSEICVMKSRVRIYFTCVWVCQLEYLLFVYEFFASLFYLLTLYNILLFSFFFSISLVFTTYYLFLRNQIELFFFIIMFSFFFVSSG